MITIVTRYDFRKEPAKYMNLAKSGPVIIVRNKQADRSTACVLLSHETYASLWTEKNGR